jgi:hypothetical protein
MAAQVIRMLASSNLPDILKNISELWSEEAMKELSPVSQRSAERAKSVFKGMF